MRRLLIIAIIIFLISSLNLQEESPFAEGIEKRKALVLYDDLTEDYGIALMNLLGHFFFEYDADMKHILKVSEDQVKETDVLFVLSSYISQTPPTSILESINFRTRNLNKVTCLIGTPSWLKRADRYQTFDYVTYKGKGYRGNYGFYPLKEEIGDSISFFSEETKAFISKKESLWIVQGFPFFGVYLWIFADLLHDILGVNHKSERSVFLRLEDVNPSYGSAELRRLEDCINFLHEEGIPFVIGVYPVFIDHKKGEVKTLLQNETLVSILKKAERMGGSIAIRGTSHQYKMVSGEGSEFWDILEDKPIPNEKEYFHTRMQYGLWIFKRAGLNPKFFEAPHYNLPPSLQLEMHQYFKTILGGIMINNKTYKVTQASPFILYKTYSGLTLLPEQLGYILEEDKMGSIERIKEKALEIGEIVRDPVVCFFYHPYLDGDKPLRELIPFFREKGFKFINPATYGSPSSFEVREVPPIWNIREERSFYFGKTFAIFAIIAAVVLFYIYLKMSHKRKRRLFEIDRLP